MSKIIEYYSKSNMFLEQIIIKNNPSIGYKSYKLIAEHIVFTDKSIVDKIDISGNTITQQSFQGFIEQGQKFFESGKKNFKLMKLILNSLSKIQDDLFLILSDILLFNSTHFELSKLSLKNTLTADKINIISKKLIQLEQKKIKLSLRHLCLDKNIISQNESIVLLLDTFLLKSQACPKLEIISLSYCNLFDQHFKDLIINYKNQKYEPVSLKKLILKGNINLASEGQFVLPCLLFTSGIFNQLESLDLGYCKLEEMSISSLCSAFTHSLKNKSETYKQPLKELILNENPLLEFDDWSDLLQTIVFSKQSQIKTLSAQNCGFDSRVMLIFLEQISKFRKSLVNEGFIDDIERHQLVNLNIQQNDGIDEFSWKEFIQVFLLNKSRDRAFDEEYKQQLKNEQEDIEHVKREFNKIEMKYYDKLQNVPGKYPIFFIKHLDLKGTTTLDQNQWGDLFKQLIITDKSHIEFLGLCQTFIEESGWDQIFGLIDQFQNIQNEQPVQLKIKRLQFNDNTYLKPNQWEQIFSNLFLNTNLMQLKHLELDNCKIDQEILRLFNKCIYSELDLEILSLRRNNLYSVLALQTNYLTKIRILYIESNICLPPDKIPQNIKKSLQELSIRLFDYIYENQIQILVAQIPNLHCLHVKGQFQNMKVKYKQLMEFVSDNLQEFHMQNQHLDSETFFPSIVQLNTSGKKSKKVNLNGCLIDRLSQEELEKMKIEENLYFLNKIKREDKRTEEQKKEDIEQQRKERRQNWEIILDLGFINNQINKDKIKNIASLNLSNIFGISESENQYDCSAIEFTLRYVGRHCHQLTELYLSNCFMSENAFQSFCQEYQKNDLINIKTLDISNNKQLKTMSWKIFFKEVLFQSKSNFDVLNLSKNIILKEEFDYLKELSSKFSYRAVSIKKLLMQDFQKNIDSSVWVQIFFTDFIKSENRKIERIYLNNSLSSESQNAIANFLKTYLIDSSCNIKKVYGYYEISQIFRQIFPKNPYSLNLAKELKNKSQFIVIDLWKKALTSENIHKIKCENYLTQEFVNGIPRMSLDLIEDFLQLMDVKSPLIQNSKPGHVNPSFNEQTTHILCFDYETIQLMSKYFSDKKTESKQDSSVNPQMLVLNQRVQQFLQKPTIYKQIFFIQHRYFDTIDTQQIYQLYLRMKDIRIDSIIMDYELRQIDLDPNLSERELIDIIKLFPPKSLELTNVSINALKAIYSILSSNNNFRYANVNFSSQSFINNGIAFSLRESIYMGKKRKNSCMKFLNDIAYTFLDLFCVEAEVYKFDKTIPDLNYSLKTTRKFFNVMVLLAFMYYIICITCPYLLTVKLGVFVKTKSGVAWESHFVYLGFAFLSFIIEIIIYKFTYSQIYHLIPNIIDVGSLETENRSIMRCLKNFLKNHIKLIEWLTYFLRLAFSQLDRFDLYSDICFIVICFKMEAYIIGFISLIVIVNQLITNIIKLFYFLFSVFVQESRRHLNTHEINSFCELSNLVEFDSLNHILDSVAPYNVSYIPNNFVFRSIMPSIAGQSISNRLLVSMQKFLFEDILQIVLQLTYVISYGDDYTVAISIISSFMSFTKAFYKFMSIRPSTISQLDFDQLSKIKRDSANKYNNQLKDYRNNMLENLSLSIDKYQPPLIIDINKPLSPQQLPSSIK